MRTLGAILLGCGLIGLLVSLGMDTSVSTSTGYGRVNNIGLMNDKQNYIIVSSVLLLAGIAMAFVGGSAQAPVRTPVRADNESRKCPCCAEIIKCEAVKCRFCGETVDAVEPDDSDYSEFVASYASKLEEARLVSKTHRVIGTIVVAIFVGLIIMVNTFTE